MVHLFDDPLLGDPALPLRGRSQVHQQLGHVQRFGVGAILGPSGLALEAGNRGDGPETLLAVYVPTNHLYLGDIVLCERDRATFPDITVEEGIRIFLTGGMALPPRFRGVRGDDRVKEFRV